MLEIRFWKTKSLEKLSPEEWEALCDDCGRCCLLKIEDEDSGDLFYTNVVCEFHDSERCRCSAYQQRTQRVTDCIKVTPALARDKKWLPDTCAYRLLAERKDLFDWHPLISGNLDSVHEAGISVRDKVVSEKYVHPQDLPGHLIQWID